MTDPVRRTPAEWAAEIGYRILDPDGWRHDGGPPFDQPLTYAEFEPRFAVSTVQAVAPAGSTPGSRAEAFARYRWPRGMRDGSDTDRAARLQQAADEIALIDRADPLRTAHATERRARALDAIRSVGIHYGSCRGFNDDVCTCTAYEDLLCALGEGPRETVDVPVTGDAL